MKADDVLQALGNVDDALLAEADRLTERGKKHRRFIRPMIAAAIVAVLTLSAAAAYYGINVRYGTKAIDGVTVAVPGHGVFINPSYQTAEIQFSLEPKQVYNNELSDCLTKAWEQWPYEDSTFTGTVLTEEGGKRRAFESLQEVGDFLGLPLHETEALRAVGGPYYVRILISDSTQAAAQYAETGRVKPTALMIESGLRIDANARPGNLTVLIALSDTLPEGFATQHMNVIEEEGTLRESRYQSDGGVEMLLLETERLANRSGTGGVYWCSDGIAYSACIEVAPSTPQRAPDMLVPLFAEL